MHYVFEFPEIQQPDSQAVRSHTCAKSCVVSFPQKNLCGAPLLDAVLDAHPPARSAAPRAVQPSSRATSSAFLPLSDSARFWQSALSSGTFMAVSCASLSCSAWSGSGSGSGSEVRS